MLHDDTPRLSANSVQPGALLPKQEAFCVAYVECGDASRAYAEVYKSPPASVASGSLRKRAFDLVHRPKVRERIRSLQAAAAEGAVVTVRQQLLDIADMAAVDVSELWRLEYRPCPACHALYDADLAARRPLPDMSSGLPPHASCSDVRAHQRVEMLPLDQWPPAARRLYDGVEMQRDGTMRPVFRDRSQLQDMLNRILGAYVSRSENITAHVTVDPSKPNPWSGASMTPAQVLERVRKSRPQPVTIEQGPTP
jgi:hypothetical protein